MLSEVSREKHCVENLKNFRLEPGWPAPLVYLSPVWKTGGSALRAGPVLRLPPVWRSGLRHAEKRRWRPGINQGQQAAQTPGLDGWHIEWLWCQAQRHALENLPATQKPPRCASPSQLLLHWPQAGLPARIAGSLNLFRNLAVTQPVGCQERQRESAKPEKKNVR